MFITPPLDDMFTPSQPASQSYVELRSALADFLIFLDRLRSAKKCASGPLLPDFLMPCTKCTLPTAKAGCAGPAQADPPGYLIT